MMAGNTHFSELQTVAQLKSSKEIFPVSIHAGLALYQHNSCGRSVGVLQGLVDANCGSFIVSLRETRNSPSGLRPGVILTKTQNSFISATHHKINTVYM